MADRWMDERDREWRDRDWRRSEAYGRGGGGPRAGATPRWDEARTWSGAADDDRVPYDDARRDRRGYGDDEHDDGGPAPRFTPQDYTGRYAGEAGRADFGYAPRETYGGYAHGAGQGYGRENRVQGPRRSEGYGGRSRHGGWEAGDDRAYDLERARGEGRTWAGDGGRSYNRDLERRYAEDLRQQPSGGSGGSGGYDDERGYGDIGRGDFLQRAGERISSWFRGDSPVHAGREDQPDDDGREARQAGHRDHRGFGPKGYRRSDERINEDVHERLTDDPWLDATDIQVAVKDREVTLSGRVDDREAKHRAERLIEEISGVSHVQNNLRVDPEALTGAGRSFGSSALEAEMRRDAELGRAGAQGEGSSGMASGAPTDPKTGVKR